MRRQAASPKNCRGGPASACCRTQPLLGTSVTVTYFTRSCVYHDWRAASKPAAHAWPVGLWSGSDSQSQLICLCEKTCYIRGVWGTLYHGHPSGGSLYGLHHLSQVCGVRNTPLSDGSCFEAAFTDNQKTGFFVGFCSKCSRSTRTGRGRARHGPLVGATGLTQDLGGGVALYLVYRWQEVTAVPLTSQVVGCSVGFLYSSRDFLLQVRGVYRPQTTPFTGLDLWYCCTCSQDMCLSSTGG